MLATMGRKIHFLENHTGADHGTAAAIAARAIRAMDGTEPAEGAIQSMSLDLLYATCRHARWAATPVFARVLADYINTGWHTGSEPAAALVSRLLADQEFIRACYPDPGPFPPVLTKDADFLFYIFIRSATAGSEQELIDDLGLGKNLIARIRTTATAFHSRDPGDIPEITFLPEIDQHFARIMTEMAERLPAVPWILDIHALRFILDEAPLPAVWSRFSAAEVVFRALEKAGRQKQISDDEFRGIIERHLPRALGDDARDAGDLTTLPAVLEDAGLIYSLQGQRRSWRLTDPGRRITADANAIKFLRVRDHNPLDLARMNPWQQVAILKRMPADPDKDRQLLRLVEDSLANLAPSSLQLIVQRLRGAGAGGPSLDRCLKEALTSERFPWLHGTLQLLVSDHSAPEPDSLAGGNEPADGDAISPGPAPD